MSKANWMAFSSANYLHSPFSSGASATYHVGLHIAAFHLWCFPKIWQDSSVNRAYFFSFSGSLLYSGASSACVTTSSGDTPKSLSLSQTTVTSEIPGWLGFPVWAYYVITATHLLHVASTAWCVDGGPPWDIQPSRQSGCHQKELCFNLNHFQNSLDLFICCQYLFFSWGVAGLESSVSLTPKALGLISGLPWCFLLEAPCGAVLPGCNVEHVFYILFCPEWPKGYCMSYPVSFVQRLLLLWAPCEIVLLGHLIEKVYSQTVIQSMHPSETHNT